MKMLEEGEFDGSVEGMSRQFYLYFKLWVYNKYLTRKLGQISNLDESEQEFLQKHLVPFVSNVENKQKKAQYLYKQEDQKVYSHFNKQFCTSLLTFAKEQDELNESLLTNLAKHARLYEKLTELISYVLYEEQISHVRQTLFKDCATEILGTFVDSNQEVRISRMLKNISSLLGLGNTFMAHK